MTGEIDVVVPVFNAYDDVLRCVDSVLSRSTGRYRVLLIDDASTDPRIGEYLAGLAAKEHPRVSVLTNPENLGFVGTCNRAFAETVHDVVLLNSDTVVTSGWLDKIRKCAASDPAIATITPFSNNAEICSFPRFCADNDWGDEDSAELTNAAIAAAAVPRYPEIPTGVGFCMFIRRSLIERTGGFDPAYAPGYGEENDLCMRASALGMRNVLLDDTYVVHAGGRSFSDSKRALQQRNLRRLLERHPAYERVVAAFIAEDPVAPIRTWASTRRALIQRSGRRGVMHVVHGAGGGTERHVRDLVDALGAHHRHYVLKAEERRWQLEDIDRGEIRRYEFDCGPLGRPRQLLGGLCASLGVTLIHVHNLSGCRDALLDSVPAIGVPYGYTFHDLGFACPTITLLDREGEYCGGEVRASACNECLGARPEFAGVDIDDWRGRHAMFVGCAEFVLAPSGWAAEMARRYFGPLRIDVIPHGFHPYDTDRATGRLTDAPGAGADAPAARATIAVVGAVGPDKGSRRLEALVERTRARTLPLRWVLIGYTDRQHDRWASDDGVFVVHGRYAREELPALFTRYAVQLVLFPSAGPETFSYTLSEAWACGLPVAVPSFGALHERVAAEGGGWVLDEHRDVDAILDELATIFSAARAGDLQAKRDRVRGIRLPSLADMAERTAEVYRRTPESPAAFPAHSNRVMTEAAARARDAQESGSWRTLLAAAASGTRARPGTASTAEPAATA